MNKLEKLVKGRFKILEGQIRQRKVEAENFIRDEVRGEHATTLKQAVEAAKKFNDRQDIIQNEINELERKHEDEMAKVENKTIKLQEEWNKKISGYAKKGIEPSYRYNNEPEELLEEDAWKITNESEEVNRRFEALKEEHGAATISLEQQEQGVLEELLINALETDDAKQFFDRIPTVEDYVPLPKGAEAKELSA